jgi:hypothetical protein
MSSFEGVLFAAISRPPQPVPEHPIPPRRAVVASFIPVVCTAVLYATFRGLDLYLQGHLTVPRLPAILIVLMGVVAPWCVGIYFAYRAARAANKILRAVGSMEVLIFLLAVAMPLVARG